MNQIEFKNRAWEKSAFPRLCLDDYFLHDDGLYYHLTIGYHHVRNQWYLDIAHGTKNKWNKINAYGKMELFNTIKEIVEYISNRWKKEAIIPDRWLDKEPIKITREKWIKTHNDYKLIRKNGQKMLLILDEHDRTILTPVEVI